MNTNYKKAENCRTVAFLTLGCKVNSYETEAMQKLFEKANYQIVDFAERADIYVINTCTVTNIADRKSRQMLHKARKMNENAIVVAVGCYVQAAKETLELDESIDLVIGNNRKKDIIDILNEYYIGNNMDYNNVVDISEEMEYEALSIESVAEKTRAYIKIQDGCNQFCSYCIIPYARGRVRSRQEDSIINEVENLVSKGYKEIVLTGIHLSSYGIDFKKKAKLYLDDNTNSLTVDYKNDEILDHSKQNDDEQSEPKAYLLQLILNLSRIEGLERIRLGSLEPRIITEEFVKTLSNNPKFCPHFHLSLQSGSNETLKRMNRKYTADEYYEKCQLIRQYFVEPAITTDVIVGFPGETEEEFTETKAFLTKIAFAQMHIFKYSVRKGTRAETMPDQVKEEKKAERSNCFIGLADELTKNYRDKFIGTSQKVLIEEEMILNGTKYQIGHNERYLKLALISENDFINQIVEVKILNQLNKEIMFCEIMD
jgi:threonylcarbamoyladenosine tRNA methylthiotransferase MtaB